MAWPSRSTRVDLLGQAIMPGARFQGDLRRNVQMVFQDPYASLHPNHTLWRTLAEPLQIHGIRDVAPSPTCSRAVVTRGATSRMPWICSGSARVRHRVWLGCSEAYGS